MAIVENNSEAKTAGSVYPLYPLSSCIELADAIKELGGANSDVQRSVLASHLRVDEKAQTLFQKLNAAKGFGLIDGRGAYSLTELAKRYFYPTNDSEKTEAALSMLSKPTAFASVIKRFDGSQLPKVETLSNIMHRDAGVPESWSLRAAAFFLRSASFVNAIDDGGFLRFNAARHNNVASKPATRETVEVNAEARDLSALAHFGKMLAAPNALTASNANVWNYSRDGDSVRVETPANLSRALWSKLEQYVKLLEPDKDPEGDI